MIAIACCLALIGSFLFMQVQRTLAGQFGMVKNTVNSVTTSVLYSPTGLSGSRSGSSDVLVWTAASPMNGNGYVITGVNNGASSSCPTIASAYTTFIGSTTGTTYTDSGSLAGGAAGTYVCYLVRTGYRAAGGPPWVSVPTWTSTNSLPTAAVLIPASVPVPTLIQTNQAADGTGNATSISASWTSTTGAGRLLVAFVGDADPTVTVTMPAGWLPGPTTGAGAAQVSVYYYPNAPSFGASSTVTANLSSPLQVALIISEWRNVAIASPFDASGTAIGNAVTTTLSTSAATVQSGELTLAAVFTNSGATDTYTPGAGWSDLGNTGTTSAATLDVIYRVQPAAGIVTATDSWTNLGDYAAAIATFKHS